MNCIRWGPEVLNHTKCYHPVFAVYMFLSLICHCCLILGDKANRHGVCVFVFEKPRTPVLTFLSACDPRLTGLTQSINKMSQKTNQKTKEMNPHLNKDNIIIVAGWVVYKMLLDRFLLSLNLMSECHERCAPARSVCLRGRGFCPGLGSGPHWLQSGPGTAVSQTSCEASQL